MYSVGDYVVKVNDGVCRVDDITYLQMSGVSSDKLYYLLVPVRNNGSRVFVPTEGREKELRYVTTTEQAEKILEKIPSLDVEWIDNSKLREQRYKEVLSENDLECLISYLKCIYAKRRQRELEGKKNIALDERYVRLMEDAVYSEMTFALECDRMEVKERILKMI